MKVAFILPSLANKGPILVVKDLIDFLLNHVSVEVLYFDEKRDLNVTVKTKKIHFFEKINFDEYDIIHSHGLRPDAYIWLNRKKIRGTCITTMHNYMYEDLKYEYSGLVAHIFSTFWRIMITRHNVIVTLSKNMEDYYKKRLPLNKRVTHIYNGRNFPAQSIASDIQLKDIIQIDNLENKGKIIGIVAQLSKRKGIDQAIRVLSLLPNYILIIIGEGKERKSLEKLADSLELNERCIFLGYKKEPHKYFSLFNFYLMCSRSEGFPLSVIEASSKGIPLICSSLPIFLEIFSQEEVVFFENENLNSLKEAILKASDLKDILGNNIQKKFKEHMNSHVMGKNYLDLYRKENKWISNSQS